MQFSLEVAVKVKLYINRGLPWLTLVPVVLCLCYNSCLGVVGELNFQEIADLLLYLLIVYRARDLDPAIDITGHPVAGRNVDPLISAVTEHEYPRMFEKPVNDARDSDVFT